MGYYYGSDYNNKVYLTEYNTIKGPKFKEITVSKFLKKLEKSIDKGGIFKRYDSTKFKFELTKDKIYYLCLDETLMANFDTGFYTPFTKELKRLLDKKEQMDKETYMLELANKQSSRGEEIDKEALPLYLSAKRKDLGFSFSDIKDYFVNFKNDLIKVWNETDHAIYWDIWPYKNFDMGEVGLYSIMISCVCLIPALALSFDNNNFWFSLLTLIPQVILYTVPALTLLYNYSKTRISRLIDFANRRKFAKEEIKSLTKGHPEIQLITNEKDKEEKYIMLDEKEEITELNKKDDKIFDFDIPKMILNELLFLTNEAEKIPNIDERNRITEKIQSLLDEYNEHVGIIENAKKDGILLIQSYEMLKFNLIPQIESVKFEIESIINDTIVSQERQDMAKLVQQKLNNMKVKK